MSWCRAFITILLQVCPEELGLSYDLCRSVARLTGRGAGRSPGPRLLLKRISLNNLVKWIRKVLM